MWSHGTGSSAGNGDGESASLLSCGKKFSHAGWYGWAPGSVRPSSSKSEKRPEVPGRCACPASGICCWIAAMVTGVLNLNTGSHLTLTVEKVKAL